MGQSDKRDVDEIQDVLAYPRAMVGPIYGYLGFFITDGGPGWLEISLDLTEKLMNKDGVLHGGMWTLIADSSMGGACRTFLRPPARVVTTQMDFRWLRSISGNRLRSIGRVLSRGRTVWHCTAELYDTDGAQVGFGSASFLVISNSSEQK